MEDSKKNTMMIVLMAFILILFTFKNQVNAQQPSLINKPISKNINFEEKLISEGEFSKNQKLYFSIKEVVVTEVTDNDSLDESYKLFISSLWNPNVNLATLIMQTPKLIALGKKIWNIIKAGRPVVNTDFMDSFSVLPKTSTIEGVFNQMEYWKLPIIKKYRVTFKNLFNSKVIDFVYNVVFQYGGQYLGKGSYLAGVSLYASDIKVSWGFSLDASSKLVNISNIGSLDDPIATAMIKLEYKAKSMIKDIQATESFFLMGNGKVKKY